MYEIILLGKLVYVGKNGVMKLKPGQYWNEIFDPVAETPDEVRHILEGTKESIHTNHVGEVFRCLKIIEELWCKGIACVYWSTFLVTSWTDKLAKS